MIGTLIASLRFYGYLRVLLRTIFTVYLIACVINRIG